MCAMSYWLMKTEPETFSFEDLQNTDTECWDGVRNHQAQNNMKQMKTGDQVLIYHSVGPREVVGIAEVTREAYPDPTANAGEKWIAVDVRALKPLSTPVKLSTIKATAQLSEIALIRQSRLSVMPLSKTDFEAILQLGN